MFSTGQGHVAWRGDQSAAPPPLPPASDSGSELQVGVWKGVEVRPAPNPPPFRRGVAGHVLRMLFLPCEVWGMGGLTVPPGFLVCQIALRSSLHRAHLDLVLEGCR